MKITDLKPNEVIHCRTKEEAVRICGMIPNALPEWWKYYESDTCFNPQGAYAFVKHYKENGYTIYPSDLFRDSSDEITEDGLRARGFSPSDLGGHYLQGAEWALHFTGSGNVELGIDSNWIATNCHTLADIDHLIRLLGV